MKKRDGNRIKITLHEGAENRRPGDAGLVFGDGAKKLIRLACALAVLAFAVVMLRYDFVNRPVTLARYLSAAEVRFAALGRFLSGRESNGLNYSIYTVIIAAFVGAALSVCGTVSQGVFRNPIASPSMLGVQSGGMVAAALYLIIRWEPSPASEFFTFEEYSTLLDGMSFFDMYERQIWMLVGCLAGAGVIIAISTRAGRGKMSSLVLIISGTLFSSFANTFTSLARFWFVYNDPTTERAYAMMGVAMGSFANTYTLRHLVMLGIPILIGLGALFAMSGRLNVIMFGEDEARTLGLNVTRFRTVVFLICATLSAVVLSFCGQMGFVGLVVPHFARQISGSNFRLLLPVSALLGALTVVLVYGVAACVGMTSSLNVITSVMGGAMFMFIMLKYRRRRNADWA
ncbi:MAG: iron ABC transporter permease [Oscillospiraceae bacterium]|jgi:iron complex transport system permease protein|nr:iron ABC transporter permease [Oscillospiraceae bacterium]